MTGEVSSLDRNFCPLYCHQYTKKICAVTRLKRAVGLGENMSMSCHFSGSVSCCGIVAFFECSEPFWVSWTSKRNVQIVSYVSFKIHTLLVLEYGGTE